MSQDLEEMKAVTGILRSLNKLTPATIEELRKDAAAFLTADLGPADPEEINAFFDVILAGAELLTTVTDLVRATKLAQVVTPPPAPTEPFDIDGVDFVKLAEHTGDAILKYFRYAHLPPALQPVSRSFAVLAFTTVRDVPRSAERTAGLRKLLEAKDCIVRAAL